MQLLRQREQAVWQRFCGCTEDVRNLAIRSANAASQTSSLIESSIKKSTQGAKLAEETAAALNKIVNGIDKVAEIVGTISIASNEQATGIAQINRGLDQVSGVVQTNSATAEESAASSAQLSNQSELLKERVDRFKLKVNSK